MLAGLDDYAPGETPSVTTGGGTGGTSTTGGSGGVGGAGGIGGLGGEGGTAPTGWVAAIEGESRVTSLAVDPADGSIWVAGLYRGLAPQLPEPPENHFGSFLAHIAEDGMVLSLEPLTADAGDGGPNVFDADAAVHIIDDEIFIATTAMPNVAVPLLNEPAIGHVDPFVVWASFSNSGGTLVMNPNSKQSCEFSGFVKGLDLAGTMSDHVVAAISGGGALNCTLPPLPGAPVGQDNIILLQRINGTLQPPTVVSSAVGTRSQPSVAAIGNARVVVGHHDNFVQHGIEFCGDGSTPGAGCTLNSSFGAFAVSYGGNGADYVGPISPVNGGPFGTVRVGTSATEFFVGLTTAADAMSMQRDVVLSRYVTSQLTERFTLATPADETIEAIAADGEGALLVGAVHHNFDTNEALGGAVFANFSDHSAGCIDGDATVAGDVYWLVLDASEEPVTGAILGDCSHQAATVAAFTLDGDLLIGGLYGGSLTTQDGDTITTPAKESAFVMKVPRPVRR
jgi:hypothetical protein